MTDQLTFDDPRTRFPKIDPPTDQEQEEPGLQSRMTPVPDLGEATYRGTGRLTGRKALVTGGDSGIGGATAIAFAREGADVAIVHLPAEQPDADHVLEQIRAAGRTGVGIVGDLTDPAFCRDLVATAHEALGGLDALALVAGKQITSKDLTELPDAQFVETYEVNVFAAFRIVQAAVPLLPPGSTVVLTASLETYQASPERIDYASTKAAINNLGKGMAQQLAEKGIRVNIVAPGPTWTALQVSKGIPPEEIEGYGSDTPLGRAAQPAELAPAYVFFSSPESSFVVGATLAVNGGTPTP
ncbi:SDR family oxidoreductase [uncultured Amnibacterium sp.]|uniref:SDR family oxidoreductase n=1 Tax=uncultured Amnibacterium sp. TaxID=1631851 RepID=UPI0035CBBB47